MTSGEAWSQLIPGVAEEFTAAVAICTAKSKNSFQPNTCPWKQDGKPGDPLLIMTRRPIWECADRAAATVSLEELDT